MVIEILINSSWNESTLIGQCFSSVPLVFVEFPGKNAPLFALRTPSTALVRSL